MQDLIEQPNTVEIDSKIHVVEERALSIIVIDDETNKKATEFVRGIKGLISQVKETFRPNIDRASKLHKSLIAEEKKHLKPLQDAEHLIKARISKYLTEQEEIRLLKQKQLEEEAKREEEKKKKELEDAGDFGEAETVHIPAPIARGAEKQEGSYTVDTWDFEIESENVIPREYLQPNLSAIRKNVQSFKNDTNIPGIKVTKKTEVRIRK